MKLPLPLTNWIYSHLERDSSDYKLQITNTIDEN